MRATIITLKSDDEFLVFSKGADDGVPPTDAEMVLMMQRAVGAELPISIIGHWPWTAGVALVAERFIAGRVILAGDAAHLFTPTGGFGMNTGMDDASNLAWKLAALVQGWGGANLLQSYELERRPIAERNTVAARELNKQPHQHADHRRRWSRTRRKARRRAARSAHICRPSARNSPRSACSSARATTARRSSPRTARRRADDYVSYTPSGVPGGRAPHYWPGQGRGSGDSLFDRFGKGFTLLRLGGSPADTRRSKPRRAGVVCRSQCSTCRMPTLANSTAATSRSSGPTSTSPGAATRRRPIQTV